MKKIFLLLCPLTLLCMEEGLSLITDAPLKTLRNSIIRSDSRAVEAILCQSTSETKNAYRQEFVKRLALEKYNLIELAQNVYKVRQSNNNAQVLWLGPVLLKGILDGLYCVGQFTGDESATSFPVNSKIYSVTNIVFDMGVLCKLGHVLYKAPGNLRNAERIMDILQKNISN
ncbi:MAG: hypothetical protein WC707_00530 [Candidatus Babeliaceae bacterium]